MGAPYVLAAGQAYQSGIENAGVLSIMSNE